MPLYLFNKVNIFGGLYNSIVDQNDFVINFIFVRNFIVSLIGNMFPLLLFSPFYFNYIFKKNKTFRNINPFLLLSLIFLFGLIFITALFTTYISFRDIIHIFIF